MADIYCPATKGECDSDACVGSVCIKIPGGVDDLKARRSVAPRIASTAYGLAYASVLPTLKQIAGEHGYALAVHGSMATDLDIVAIPWAEKASAPEALIEAIREAVGGTVDIEGAQKPHGRRAWSILPHKFVGMPRLDWVPWLDVSVMPRAGEP